MVWKNRREREAIGKLWSALRKEHYPGVCVCVCVFGVVDVEDGGVVVKNFKMCRLCFLKG